MSFISLIGCSFPATKIRVNVGLVTTPCIAIVAKTVDIIVPLYVYVSNIGTDFQALGAKLQSPNPADTSPFPGRLATVVSRL